MKITKIKFHDGEVGIGVNDCANGNYRARFVMVADGTDYTGMAWLNVEEGFGIDWDAVVPEYDALAKEIVEEAFLESVAIEVVCRPVDLEKLLSKDEEEEEDDEEPDG
jgi:hypothetical protein